MAQPHNGRTVLIIDDDADFRGPVGVVLEAHGYRVRSASGGDEGLRMAAEETPDLILLDFLMPDKNGLETLRDLEGTPALANVPVLALTSLGQTAIAYYAPAAKHPPRQIRAFLEKPIEFGVLLTRVATVLGQNEPRATS